MEVTNYLLTGMILQVGGGFKYLFLFSPLLGEMIQFDWQAYFSNGLVGEKPPTMKEMFLGKGMGF